MAWRPCEIRGCPGVADLETGRCGICGKLQSWAHERSLDPRRRPEARIRMEIRRALEALGFEALDFEQGYRRDGSSRVPRGTPDLYVRGHGRRFWVEVKRPGAKLTAWQRAWHEAERRAGGEVYVWRSAEDAVEWWRGVRGKVA